MHAPPPIPSYTATHRFGNAPLGEGDWVDLSPILGMKRPYTFSEYYPLQRPTADFLSHIPISFIDDNARPNLALAATLKNPGCKWLKHILLRVC